MKSIKLWLKAIGLTNFGYILGFIFALLIGFKSLGWALLGIFIYINWNVIRKIARKNIKEIL